MINKNKNIILRDKNELIFTWIIRVIKTKRITLLE